MSQTPVRCFYFQKRNRFTTRLSKPITLELEDRSTRHDLPAMSSDPRDKPRGPAGTTSGRELQTKVWTKCGLPPHLLSCFWRIWRKGEISPLRASRSVRNKDKAIGIVDITTPCRVSWRLCEKLHLCRASSFENHCK